MHRTNCVQLKKQGLKEKIDRIIVRQYSSILMAMVAILMMASCTEDTGSLGIPPSNETLESSTAILNVYSRSMKIDSIQARSAASYLGAIYDPETNGRLTSNFATQFAILEDVKPFPPLDSITSRDALGNPCCDSVMLQLNFDGYFGDVNAPLKLAIYPLDPANPLDEDSTYYTSTDLRKYIRPGYENNPIATKVFTAWDRVNGSDPSNSSAGKYPSIRVPMPVSEGNMIMDKYRKYLDDNKGLSEDKHVNHDFDDSYHFVRNVLPGYYAEIINGEGVMVRVFVDALYLIYNARALNDSIVEEVPSYTVFAGTPEVIQSCQFSQADVDDLVADESCTWIKSPVGICTEITLPIDDIFANGHEEDSISRIELMMTRYNREQSTEQAGEHFGIPQNLLLVRKRELSKFFKENRTPDATTSYVTSFSSTYNTYTFSNIGQMATFLHKERETAVLKYIKEELHEENPTAEMIAEQTREWTLANPDWNKCCLVPVEITTNTSTGTVTSVSHELSLAGAKLVRGTEDNPIRIQVYYTRVVTGNNGK